MMIDHSYEYCFRVMYMHTRPIHNHLQDVNEYGRRERELLALGCCSDFTAILCRFILFAILSSCHIRGNVSDTWANCFHSVHMRERSKIWIIMHAYANSRCGCGK